MYQSKKKVIGGRTYRVMGSTIEYSGRHVAEKRYTTPAGIVKVKGGVVYHPDGTTTPE